MFRVWTDDAFASQVGRWLGGHPMAAPPPAPAPLAIPVPAAQPAKLLPRLPRQAHASPASPAAASPASLAAGLPAPAAAPGAPARNDALSLLAVLQRDAQLVDFFKAPIAAWSDPELGAAARPVHREAAAVLDRIFGLVPLVAEAAGALVELPAGYDPGQFRLVGDAPAAGPVQGTLLHSGWRALRADVPGWAGKSDAATVVSPVEVRVE